MTFLYPEFLYALPALAIPVIVHLFNFRRAKRIYFSSTRFLKQIDDATSRKRKLKHYLILASRLLFLFFVIVAFAQPFIPSSDSEIRADNVYVYLDNSPSMSVSIADETSGLSLGMAYVAGLLELYPGNTNYRFLTNEFAAFSNVYKSRAEIEDLLTEIGVSNISRSLPEAYSRLMAAPVGTDSQPVDIYIISDFQKSTSGEVASMDISPEDRVVLAPISLNNPGNLFIDSVFLSNPFSPTSDRNQVNAVVRNTGAEAISNLQLRLYVNDVLSANSSVEIGSNSRATAHFELNFRLEAINACRIEFDDYPVSFDDDFYFVLKREEALSILELKAVDETTPVGRVFANPDLFRFSSQLIRNPDYSSIRQADLIVLSKPGKIEPALMEALLNYLSLNGSLFIIPEGEPHLQDLRSLTGAEVRAGEQETMEPLAMPDPANPFFQYVFESAEGNFDLPQARNSVQWTTDQGTLLQLRNGLRYLSVFRNPGNVYLLASPLDDNFSNLHRHALFVPVMYRSAALSRKTAAQLYYPIQDPLIRITLDSIGRKKVFRLRSEREEVIPDQRIIGNELQLELQKNLLSPGFYSLIAEDSVITILAFNRDRNESQLIQYSPEELRESFSLYENVAIFEGRESEEFLSEIRTRKIGVPLWKYAVILALTFLLFEVIFIRFVNI